MERLSEFCEEIILNPYKRKLTKSELMNLLSDNVIGLIAGIEMIDREVLEKSSLKVVSRCGSGISNIDIQAAREVGVIIRNTPSGPTTAVAELTVGCLISLLRKVHQMDHDLHDGQWKKQIGKQISGSRVAIIGFGRIGRKVAKLLSSFDANICAVDPEFAGVMDNFPIVSLAEALEQADIICIHANGEECLLNEYEFRLLKKGAYILNASRGHLINEEALKRSLLDGRVAGAWLDTFTHEPYSGELCKFEQVILTPHIGSYTAECRRTMEMEAVENLIDAIIGK